MASPFDLLDYWQISAAELAELVASNPSLRGMLQKCVAERKLIETWFSDEDDSWADDFEDGEEDGEPGGDRGNEAGVVVEHEGHHFRVECKSLQPRTVRRSRRGWIGDVQMQGKERRRVRLADGTELVTPLRAKGSFDLLAVSVFDFQGQWDFAFAKNGDLPSNSPRRNSPQHRGQLIRASVPVRWPPEPPFYDDPFRLLDELATEKGEPAGT